MPKVSVMMPAYNVEKYIGEAIESILNQTFQDYELIIIDDGSTDSTYNIMEEYRRKHEKIRIFKNKENKGLSFTRNRLLSLAKGDYLAILDSDDIAFPYRIEKQVNFLDKNPPVGLLGGAVEYFNDINNSTKISKRLKGSDKIACRLLFQNVFGQSTVMFRKEFADLKYREEYPPAEDYDLWVRMSWQTQTDNLADVMIRYRTHQNNISTIKREERLENVRAIYKMQLERMTIIPKKRELDIHELIADNSMVKSIVEFQEALNWIRKLYFTNIDRKIYPQDIFKEELQNRLNEICVNSLHLGQYVATQVWSSDITKRLLSKQKRIQLWILAKGKGKDTGKFYPLLYRFYKKIVY